LSAYVAQTTSLLNNLIRHQTLSSSPHMPLFVWACALVLKKA